MKRFLILTVLVVALAAIFSGAALAAPATPPAQGFVPGAGMRVQGTDLTGTCGMVGGAAGGMMGRGAPAWAGQPDEVAALLGMTAEEIQAERQAGKSLAQIAAGKNISVDTLVSTILTAKKANLAQLVADGTLTQAQADLMLERMETQVKLMVERTTVGPMMGRGQGTGMRGAGRGFRG